jgi:integrase
MAGKCRSASGPNGRTRGPPAPGYFTRKTAGTALQATLTDARRGLLTNSARSGATVADAAGEWLRHAEVERGVKPSTLAEYESVVRTHVLLAFGDLALEAVDSRMIEKWQAERLDAGRLSRRTINKTLAVLGGIFERARRVWKLDANPVREVSRKPERYSGDLDFLSPEEVQRLVEAAESEQDGTLFLVAAFCGLRRGELIALAWRDVLFEQDAIRVRASYTYGHLSTPKSGKARTVPMVPQVAKALAQLSLRGEFVGEHDLVFPRADGHFLDGSAVTRRYKAALVRAGLRPLRFHDLRHSFGSTAINFLSILEVKEATGHADIRTTMRYLHAKSRADEARRLAQALRSRDARLATGTRAGCPRCPRNDAATS